jgi:hypothetical protein
VGRERLGLRDRHAGGGQRGARAPHTHLGHPAPEVADIEAGGEARRALGGQDVVRTRDVVAERGARRRAHEQAARGANPGCERLGGFPRELEMLRRELFDERQGLFHAEQYRMLRLERVQDRLVVAHRDGQRPLAVLGLARQVGLQRLEIGARGRHDGQIRRPGEPVDADHAGHLPLGLLHPQRPRADDHVHLRNRLGPVRQRGDRLGARDGEVGVRAAQLRRGDHHRMRRADHVHLVHTRGARRHDAHHDRRRIRIAAAGRVDGGAPHRHVAQLHGMALRERDEAIAVEARLRHRAHVVDRDLEPGAHGVVEHPGLRREGRTRAGAEADLELLERRIATGAHPGDDPGDVVRHRRARRDGRADLVSPSHAASPGPRRSPPPSRGRRPGWRSGGPSRRRSSRG